MLATGGLWFLGGFVGIAVFAHRGPLIHLLVSYPRGRLRNRMEHAVVAAGYLDALVYPIGRSAVVTIGLAGSVTAVTALGYRQSHGAERRARLTSTLATAAVMGVLAVGAAARLTGRDIDHTMLVAYEVTLIAVAVVLFADTRWGRWDRAAVTTLAIDLGQDSSSGPLRERLAAALGDPTLVLGYITPGGDELIDETRRPIAIETDQSGRSSTPILDAGKQIAVLVHDSAVLDDPALLGAVAALTKIAIANTRLQSEVENRVAEVETSRRRLITVADAERARLEAALHAGPERRLTRVACLLADLSDPGTGLLEQLATSQEAIRDFARGVHPHTLTESGLGSAISELVSTASVPVEVSGPQGGFDHDVEAAAYFVCAEALTNIAKYAHASKAHIRFIQQPGELIVEISDDGVGGADPSNGSGLIGLIDRLDALGGTLTVYSPPEGGTRLTGRIPLAGN